MGSNLTRNFVKDKFCYRKKKVPRNQIKPRKYRIIFDLKPIKPDIYRESQLMEKYINLINIYVQMDNQSCKNKEKITPTTDAKIDFPRLL